MKKKYDIFVHIHTMEYYLAIKKDKIMSFAGKWMELKIIMQSEINQTQEAKYHTCGWGMGETYIYIYMFSYIYI
jgi:hypothetical protein